MLLTDKYADKIYGIIACYDRMIIQGYIPNMPLSICILPKDAMVSFKHIVPELREYFKKYPMR